MLKQLTSRLKQPSYFYCANTLANYVHYSNNNPLSQILHVPTKTLEVSLNDVTTRKSRSYFQTLTLPVVATS